MLLSYVPSAFGASSYIKLSNGFKPARMLPWCFKKFLWRWNAQHIFDWKTIVSAAFGRLDPPPKSAACYHDATVGRALSFMIRSIALAISLLACSRASAAVYVTVEDWFNAPPEQQVSYVAGTLDTLLSSSTSALAKGMIEQFVHCVSDSHLTAGQLADDIRKHPPKGLVSMQAVVLVSLTQRCGPPNPQ